MRSGYGCTTGTAGIERICLCLALAPPSPPPPSAPPTPPPPLPPADGIDSCHPFVGEHVANAFCETHNLDAANAGVSGCRVSSGNCGTRRRRLSEQSPWVASGVNQNCAATCGGIVDPTGSTFDCPTNADVTATTWFPLQNEEWEAVNLFASTPGFDACTQIFATNQVHSPYQSTSGPTAGFCYFSTADENVDPMPTDCAYAATDRRLLCYCIETPAPIASDEFNAEIFSLISPLPPSAPPPSSPPGDNRIAIDACGSAALQQDELHADSCIARHVEAASVRCCPTTGSGGGRSICWLSGTANFRGASCDGGQSASRRRDPVYMLAADQCPFAASWDEATAECAAQLDPDGDPMRLCTVQELKDDTYDTCASGCGADNNLVWALDGNCQPPSAPPPGAPPSPPMPMYPAVVDPAQCEDHQLDEANAKARCHAYNSNASNVGECRVSPTSCAEATRRRLQAADDTTFVPAGAGVSCDTACGNAGLVCTDYAAVTDAPWISRVDTLGEMSTLYFTLGILNTCQDSGTGSVIPYKLFEWPLQFSSGMTCTYLSPLSEMTGRSTRCSFSNGGYRFICPCNPAPTQYSSRIFLREPPSAPPPNLPTPPSPPPFPPPPSYRVWGLPVDVCGYVSTGNSGRYIYDTRQEALDGCLAHGCSGLADPNMVTDPTFDWQSTAVEDTQYVQASGGGGRCMATWWDTTPPGVAADRPG